MPGKKNDRKELEAHIRLLEKKLEQFRQKEEEHALNEVRLETLSLLQRMTAASLDEITEFALESSLIITRSTIGYISFLNKSEDVITMHSWSRHAMRDCAMQIRPLRYPLEKTGLWGEAVRQRKPIVTNDYQFSNPLKKGYPKGHVDLKRHMNVPVTEGERIVMVAGVANKAEAYDDTDVKQLMLLMHGTWNIIQRKKATEKLHEQIALLEGVLNAIQDVISIQGPDLVIDRCNKAGYEMLGMTPEQVHGKKCYTLMGRSLRCDPCPMVTAQRTKRPAAAEKYAPDLRAWFDCRCTPLFDEDDHIVRIIQQLRDISDEKLAQKKELVRKRRLKSQLMNNPRGKNRLKRRGIRNRRHS
jgi:PAS domain-containing protein